MHAIYERITVAGPEIVGVRLTAAACAHGLAQALPERLKWRARRYGTDGHGVHIGSTREEEDRDEWLAAARRLA